MSLTQPSGLSAAQKRRLKQNEPTMDDVTGIPEAVATEADLSTMIEELASTDSGKGASCIGYEGGTTVQAQVAANTASIAALGGGGSTGFDAETAGAGGLMDLYEATANGTNKVRMQAPASLAADRTITVPDADVTLADIATNTAAIAAATTDTGVGAGNAGKLVELDGSGLLDGRNIGDDGTKLDGIETAADVTDLANVTTALSVTAAAAVATSAGAGDAGKLAKLDAGGKWDSSMVPATAPAAHATSHTDGSDDIQSATNAQKGLATAAQITALETATSDLAYINAASIGLDTTHSPLLLYRASDGDILTDEGSIGQNLAVQTGSACYAPSHGRSQKSLIFSSLRLNAAANAGWQLLGDMTFLAWVRVNSHSGTQAIASPSGVGLELEADNAPWSLRLASGAPDYLAETGAGTNITYTLTGYKVPLGEWFLLGFTRESNEVQFYLNGYAFGAISSGLSAPTGASTSQMYVGDVGDGSSFLDGQIAAIKLIGSVLTPAQMLAEAQRCRAAV